MNFARTENVIDNAVCILMTWARPGNIVINFTWSWSFLGLKNIQK